ncbi:hypothetical protein ACJMK2_032582, partial [Sinanodonta woodiana]
VCLLARTYQFEKYRYNYHQVISERSRYSNRREKRQNMSHTTTVNEHYAVQIVNEHYAVPTVNEHYAVPIGNEHYVVPIGN